MAAVSLRAASRASAGWPCAVRGAAVALGLLLLTACAGGEPGGAEEAPWWSGGAEATVVAATPGATAGGPGGAGGDSAGAPQPSAAASEDQAPTAPDDEPAPLLAEPGSSPEEVWGQMTARHTWLYRHPDPAGLEEIYAPDCSCLSEGREQLAGLAAQGRWWTGERPELTAVEVRDAAAPDLLALRATYARRGDSQLVDATGTVHQTLPPRESIVVDIVLVREGSAAPWLVRALSQPFATPGVTP